MTQHPTDADSPDPQNPGEAPNRSPAGEPRGTLDIPHEESVNEDMNTFTTPFASQDAMALLAQELTPKRAVSYLRVSTREQAQRGGHEEGFSIPAQRAANKRKAKTVGATIVKEFVERGASGTSTRRPALQAMLRYLEETIASGETIDYVIVHKLDRLARNRADDVVLNQRFDELGTRLISTSENIDQTPGGMLLHGIMASISEFYSNNLSSEVKKGLSEKARNGDCIGKAPLGYRNTTTTSNGREAHIATIDPDRAELITWAFTAYATGDYTLKSLAAELNSRGLTVPATARLPERPISIQSLHRILSNPFYTGQVVYHDCLYPGTHQALVDQQTFQRVQAILAGRVNGERTIRPALPEVHRLLRHLPLTPDHHHRQTQADHLPVLRLPGPPLQETTRLHLPRHPDRDRRGRGRTPLPAHPPAVHPARGAGTGTLPPTSPHGSGHPAAADPDHRHPAEARAPAAQAPPSPLRGRHPRRATTQRTTTYHPQPNRCQPSYPNPRTRSRRQRRTSWSGTGHCPAHGHRLPPRTQPHPPHAQPTVLRACVPGARPGCRADRCHSDLPAVV